MPARAFPAIRRQPIVRVPVLHAGRAAVEHLLPPLDRPGYRAPRGGPRQPGECRHCDAASGRECGNHGPRWTDAPRERDDGEERREKREHDRDTSRTATAPRPRLAHARCGAGIREHAHSRHRGEQGEHDPVQFEMAVMLRVEWVLRAEQPADDGGVGIVRDAPCGVEEGEPAERERDHRRSVCDQERIDAGK